MRHASNAAQCVNVQRSDALHHNDMPQRLTALDRDARLVDALQQSFQAHIRIDTPVEWEFYRNGGILSIVLRRLASGSANG